MLLKNSILFLLLWSSANPANPQRFQLPGILYGLSIRTIFVFERPSVRCLMAFQ